MSKATDAADSIRRAAKQYEAFVAAADILEQIGSLDNAKEEAGRALSANIVASYPNAVPTIGWRKLIGFRSLSITISMRADNSLLLFAFSSKDMKKLTRRCSPTFEPPLTDIPMPV